MNIDTFGGRRFLLVLFCAIMSIFLIWFEKIGGGEFVTLITLTVVPYVGFNTQEKIKGRKE